VTVPFQIVAERLEKLLNGPARGRGGADQLVELLPAVAEQGDRQPQRPYLDSMVSEDIVE
jgi:hypothetical protein